MSRSLASATPIHLYVAAVILALLGGFALVVAWQLLAGIFGPGGA